MMKELTDKKRKILRRVYGALSLSSALFIFQACYGTPQDNGMDVLLQGTVRSKTTHQPIAGIKVSVGELLRYEITDSQGKFKIYTASNTVYIIKFEDIDSTKNGAFVSKDTVVRNVDETTCLNVSLDVK